MDGHAIWRSHVVYGLSLSPPTWLLLCPRSLLFSRCPQYALDSFGIAVTGKEIFVTGRYHAIKQSERRPAPKQKQASDTKRTNEGVEEERRSSNLLLDSKWLSEG